jgi:hypothetical protein
MDTICPKDAVKDSVFTGSFTGSIWTFSHLQMSLEAIYSNYSIKHIKNYYIQSIAHAVNITVKDVVVAVK